MNDTEQFYDSKRLVQLSSPERKEVTTVDITKLKNPLDKVTISFKTKRSLPCQIAKLNSVLLICFTHET